MDQKQLQEQLKKFKTAFKSDNVSIFANCLVYKTSENNAQAVSEVANITIQELGLNLIAEPSNLKDSFIVQEKK